MTEPTPAAEVPPTLSHDQQLAAEDARALIDMTAGRQDLPATWMDTDE